MRLRQESESIRRQQREEKETEARAFRLASRGRVSEEIFDHELRLIRARQNWLAEQQDLLEGQLADILRYWFDPAGVEELRKRLEARLATATDEDRRYVLQAVGATVIAHADGTWEPELQIPREADELLQTANTGPRSNSL